MSYLPLTNSLISLHNFHHPKTIIHFLFHFNISPIDLPIFNFIHNVSSLFDEFNSISLLNDFDSYSKNQLLSLKSVCLIISNLFDSLDSIHLQGEHISHCRSRLNISKLLYIKHLTSYISHPAYK